MGYTLTTDAVPVTKTTNHTNDPNTKAHGNTDRTSNAPRSTTPTDTNSI